MSVTARTRFKRVAFRLGATWLGAMHVPRVAALLRQPSPPAHLVSYGQVLASLDSVRHCVEHKSLRGAYMPHARRVSRFLETHAPVVPSTKRSAAAHVRALAAYARAYTALWLGDAKLLARARAPVMRSYEFVAAAVCCAASRVIAAVRIQRAWLVARYHPDGAVCQRWCARTQAEWNYGHATGRVFTDDIEPLPKT